MTWAAESAKAGKRPLTVVELDLDYCDYIHPAGVAYAADYHSDTIAAIDKNLCTYSEDYTQWNSANVTLADDATTPPSGVTDVTLVTITTNPGYVDTSIEDLTDNLQYTVSMFIKGSSAGQVDMYFYDDSAAAYRAQVTFTEAAGVWSKFAETVGTGDVTSLGDGWYRIEATTTAGSVVAANNNYAGGDIWGAVGETIYVSGIMAEQATAASEYQFTEARDGTSTNITLTTGGLTMNQYAGGDSLCESTNQYAIEQSGLGYVRVTGDASGESLTDDIELTTDTLCSASEANTPCYNTRTTCQATSDYTAGTKTYRFCTAGCTLNEQQDVNGIPSVTSANPAPAVMAIAEGLGKRAGVSVTFRDHPHHDRGVDPYVAGRSYTPESQGTYWTKLRARNPYYQGRALRIKEGYISDSGVDLTNDFKTHHYIIERMSGPDASGTVTITGKDVLKLADDKRAQAPAANTGVLDGAYTSGDGSFTLSPSGIGNSEYSASGVLRIGSELMTFTRAGDTVTVTGEGQYNTTAANHADGDTVQECLVYSAQDLADVVYDLLVTRAGIDASYVTLATWQSETADWLSSHSVDAVISEPTGIRSLLDELCSVYMVSLWWDDESQAITLKVLAPSTTTFDSYTEASGLFADSVRVSDDPSERLSQVWVHYNIIDPTGDYEDPRNYSTVYIYEDTAAESADEYGETRVKKMYSRWFDGSGDAVRLAQRTLLRYRDNPRAIEFALSAANHYQPGDVVEITSRAIVDEDGASAATKVEILESSAAVLGHSRRYRGEEYAFSGSYMRIAANSTNDWAAATAAEKLIAGWICANDGTYQSDGTDGYKIV